MPVSFNISQYRGPHKTTEPGKQSSFTDEETNSECFAQDHK